jgi:uncharacterized surface protein with fasciclin (FAS1) repeats
MRDRSGIRSILYIFAIVCGLFQGCAKTPTFPPGSGSQGNTITQVLSTFTNASLFYSLVKRTGFDTTLNETGPFTVFAATDTAFKALGLDSLVLLNTPDSFLYRVVSYAIIDGSSLGSATLPVGPNAKIITAGGDSIYVSQYGNGIFVNGIIVSQANVSASNGTINALVSPLIPPSGTLLQTLQADTIYSFMAAAIARASLGSTNLDSLLTFSPYTIFVPVNSAFQAVGYSTINDINSANPDSLASLVSCHILAQRLFSSDFNQMSTPLTLNGTNLDILAGTVIGIKGAGNNNFANLITANIMASNGVIHIISGVLLP